MARAFKSFVILAGMRTGSNLLEELLASVPDLVAHGELFNPHFFGKPDVVALFGQSLNDRADDPLATLAAMRDCTDGLPGFRLFHDHDPRVLTHVLSDRSCAKVILTRRPVDSFVSLQIARSTGQWWLGDATSARTAQITFDPDAYAEFADNLDAFHRQITRALQTSGQTAFRLTYDDLSDVDVLAGLTRFLGVKSAPDPGRVRARVQNPTPVEDRLTNPQDAWAALKVDLGEAPLYEPERGPGLRHFHVCNDPPLIYMPIRGAATDPIPAWLAAFGAPARTGMAQPDLRRWRRESPGHRSFTVLRQPLPRAHDAFCRYILPTDQPDYADIRDALRHRFDVPLPEEWPTSGWLLENHRAAFLGFLTFLKANLGGQTSLRVDTSWATQERLLSAIARYAVPDRVLREGTLTQELKALAGDMGVAANAKAAPFTAPEPYALSDVATPEIEKAAKAAYRRDYLMFGFGPWRPPPPQAA